MTSTPQWKAGIVRLHLLPTKTSLYIEIYKGVKGEKIKEIDYANTNQKELGMAKSMSDKADFRAKNIMRNKEGCFIMGKMAISLSAMMILNVYT